MSHSVRRHLRVEVDAYDEIIRRFIPGYEAMLGVAARAVAASQPRLVLDLGAGTGALSEAILRHEDVGTVELVDVDAEMLDQARARLESLEGRTRFREQSFMDPLPRCDAVMASLALHHIPAMKDKRSLYRRVHAALRRGGLFVNADAVMPSRSPEREAEYAFWAGHMASQGIPEARAYQHFEEWADEDTYFPVEEELAAMRAAGFDAEIAWNEGPIAVLVGRKRSPRIALARMSSAAILLACAVAAVAGHSAPLAGQAPAGVRSYDAPRASAAPAIDGALDDAAWQDAPWTEPFVDIRGEGWPIPAWSTRARIIWDDDALYVGAEIEEPHLWATLAERDAIVYREHDFEVFLDPDGDGLEYYELEINALGTEFDLFLGKPYSRGGRAHIDWDMAGLRTAVRLDGTLNDPSDEDEGWTVEIAIPWSALRPPEGAEAGREAAPEPAASPIRTGSSLGAEDESERDPAGTEPGRAPNPGDEWRVNFSRVQWPLIVVDGGYRKTREPVDWSDHPEDNWVWSPQGEIDMHLPERWGVVRFVAGARK